MGDEDNRDANDALHSQEEAHSGKTGLTHHDEWSGVSSLMTYDTVIVKTDRDENEPYSYDVDVLDVDGVQTTVVTDVDNNCVKAFYSKKNHTCCSRLQLTKPPWGTTRVKENQILVAVPESREILTVEVSPDLVLLSSIATKKCYISLSFLPPSSIVAGGSDPPSLDIVSMAGHVTRSVTKYKGKSLFASPLFLDTTVNKIFVSDLKKKCVVCLTLELDVVWQYPSPDEKAVDFFPAGISLTTQGGIFVADTYSNKIIILNESGNIVRDVITANNGLIKPAGICICGNEKITVCDSDHLKVYTFAKLTM